MFELTPDVASFAFVLLCLAFVILGLVAVSIEKVDD